MHVILVCASEKRAIARTAAVLDAYALRIGDRTWQSPMTVEGLAEVRAALRRSASKNTAVACWRNDGRTRMRLLWTVGRAKTFARDGAFAVATKSRKVRVELPSFARAAAVIANASGLAHDLGKYAEAFQKKLHSITPVADAIRHEWLSVELLDFFPSHGGGGNDQPGDFNTAWQSATERAIGRRMDSASNTPFDHAIASARDALKFAVVTHHRLPYEGTAASKHPVSGVMNPGTYFRETSDRNAHRKFMGPTPIKLLERLHKAIQKSDAIDYTGDAPRLYWRAVALFARMALILADHSVSARPFDERLPRNEVKAFANTKKIGNARRLDQPLDLHLNDVGSLAGDLIHKLWSYQPPALCPASRERIDARSGPGRFEWQDRAVDAIHRAGASVNAPVLVLNVAATGSGKTRANVRLLSALRKAADLRIATALNLRSLTLQVADSYRKELGIERDELDCVIGDRRAMQLHGANQTTDPNDDDDNPLEAEFEASESGDPPPPWLEPFFERRPKMRSVVATPMLVSTIDFLVAAGEPNMQAHHAIAMTRVMNSDLILDEIDSYDPKALVAVLRLVMYAAFWGRNVVASSATLSVVVANALHKVFEFGCRMRNAAMPTEANWRIVLVSDTAQARVLITPDLVQYQTQYEAFIEETLAPLATKSLRPAALWPMTQPVAVAMPRINPRRQAPPTIASAAPTTGKSWNKHVVDAADEMHRRHRWALQLEGGRTVRVSLGLIRVANIGTCIDLARHMVNSRADKVRVVAYHSQLLMLQRWHVERSLDELLTRKGDESVWKKVIGANEDVLASFDAETNDLSLIVVATPVEEIGRDHDFDWAVIEPSSTQSIVQCAGRVNRHRLAHVDSPNVAVLQFNKRAWDNLAQNTKGAVFKWPGLETESSHERIKDLGQLFDWPHAQQIDARLRFDTVSHKFPRYDDAALQEATSMWLDRLTGDDAKGNLWMSESTYANTPLRSHDTGQQTRWKLEIADDGEVIYKQWEHKAFGDPWTERPSSESVRRTSRRVKGTWLTPHLSDLMEQASARRLEPAKYLEVQVRLKDDDALHHDGSFGFYRQSTKT